MFLPQVHMPHFAPQFPYLLFRCFSFQRPPSCLIYDIFSFLRCNKYNKQTNKNFHWICIYLSMFMLDERFSDLNTFQWVWPHVWCFGLKKTNHTLPSDGIVCLLASSIQRVSYTFFSIWHTQEKVVHLQKELCLQFLTHHRNSVQDKYLKAIAEPNCRYSLTYTHIHPPTHTHARVCVHSILKSTDTE